MDAKGTYGRVCPVALTSELPAERRTPLMIRVRCTGSRRFGDIQHGVPRMSPTMLSLRLRERARARIVVRRLTRTSKIEYQLTEASKALGPIVMAFASCGKKFAHLRIQPGEVDPALLIREFRRGMDVTALPETRSVILFRFPDASRRRRCWWLVAGAGDVEIFLTHPGFDVDLTVDADTATLARLWHGDESVEQALRSGKIRLDGSEALRRSFGRWVGVSPMVRARKIGPPAPPQLAAGGR